MKQKTNRLLAQMVRYALSGGAYFWSGYALFAILYSGLGVDVGWSKILSNGFGLTVNFLLQRWWVFRSKQATKTLPETSARYVLLMAINFVIDYGIVIGLAGVGLTPYIGQFVSAGFFTVWNYLWYKLWVFAPHPHLTAHGRQHVR